jgi:hypothetical protein
LDPFYQPTVSSFSSSSLLWVVILSIENTNLLLVPKIFGELPKFIDLYKPSSSFLPHVPEPPLSKSQNTFYT